MNSSPHHSKVKVTITLADPRFVAGAHVSGKLEMECRAHRGLGIGIMMVELFAIQRTHCLKNQYMNEIFNLKRRTDFERPFGDVYFPSQPLSFSRLGLTAFQRRDPHLPQHYYQARCGQSTFLF